MIKKFNDFINESHNKKKIKLRLVGLDGNAYSLMGAFRSQARREGWTDAEIDEVMTDAMSSDYDHLVAVLANHCENPGGSRYDYEDDDDYYDEDDY